MRPESFSVAELLLDAKNPRLPDGVGDLQSSLMAYFAEYGTLVELADSMLDNGYFEAERIIVLETDDGPVAVEGNRRLATLKILHGLPGTDEYRLTDREVTPAMLERLDPIPCLVVESREHLTKYLAYRHIGGQKTWSPEAKARFLRAMVADAVEEGSENVFRTVGRRVGSNALGVRNSYIALSVLERGRDEYGLDVGHVQFHRFGVWIRCMNSPEIRAHINLGSPLTYEEVDAALGGIDEFGLSEVLRDLTPQAGTRKARLHDSRDVTDYGRILANEMARTALRKYGDLEVARQVILRMTFVERVERVSSDTELLLEELVRLGALEDADRVLLSAKHLEGLARTLRASIADLVQSDD